MFGISLELYLVLNVFASLCSCLSDSYVRIELAFDTIGLLYYQFPLFSVCSFRLLLCVCVLHLPKARDLACSDYQLRVTIWAFGSNIFSVLDALPFPIVIIGSSIA